MWRDAPSVSALSRRSTSPGNGGRITRALPYLSSPAKRGRCRAKRGGGGFYPLISPFIGATLPLSGKTVELSAVWLTPM